MSRYIDADYVNAFPIRIDHYDEEHGNRHFVLGIESVMEYIEEAPSIEPNRILPERMERGDIYEVGETIVVMNHDDYYDLLCKSWEPKRGEWIVYEGEWKDFDYYPPKCKCNQCGYEEDLYILNAKPTDFCPNCGARMKGADKEVEWVYNKRERLWYPYSNGELLFKDEPQTDCDDFADRLAYERGVKHAWEVAQKVFNSTVTFYEAEDVAKQIAKDEPQTDCPKTCPSIDICIKDDTDCPWK